jgi:prepilin-type N-terminal cleavage/methylation domain-containing protein
MPKRAFTLIELLIVVAIIAIVAAIAVPNFLEAQTRSKIARAKADMATIATDWDSGLYGVTGLLGEWKTYASLSTPVAFISAGPHDPFNTKFMDQGDYFYEYYAEDAVIKFQDAWYSTWRSRGIHWFVYSFGPNIMNEALAQDQELAVRRSYDPTNGTTSSGDLGRSSAGVVPQP